MFSGFVFPAMRALGAGAGGVLFISPFVVSAFLTPSSSLPPRVAPLSSFSYILLSFLFQSVSITLVIAPRWLTNRLRLFSPYFCDDRLVLTSIFITLLHITNNMVQRSKKIALLFPLFAAAAVSAANDWKVKCNGVCSYDTNGTKGRAFATLSIVSPYTAPYSCLPDSASMSSGRSLLCSF
jgi:hypothetical protein